MTEPFIVHAHIPKTGGSALNRRMLFPMYGEDNVYQLYRFVFERASRLPRRHVARAMRSFVAVGHVPFGYFDDVYPDAVYVSVFRDPVARYMSFLNFVVAREKHGVHRRIGKNLVDQAAEEPDAYVNAVLDDPRLTVIHGNVQTRLASGTARLGDAPVTMEHLSAALSNVARERYVCGSQEDLPSLFDRLRESFPHMRRPKATSAELEKRLPKALHLDGLALRTIDRIRAANDLDTRLYAALCDTAATSFAKAA
ncbi:MAG: hypothetical protein AAF479_10555 [Pseudomonadota bacterium]